MDGMLLVDKPAGRTSHDMVEAVRRTLQVRKVGHTGTLDPDATGLLVLCLGKALKIIEFMGALDKEYDVTVRLGVSTDTEDMSGKVLSESPVPPLTREALGHIVRGFVGDILQEPPAISAVNIEGERAYRLARRGVEIHPKPRSVRVHAIDIMDWTSPLLKLLVRCSGGTYVRALARDIGRVIGCGGAVERLRRTRIGPFDVDHAVRVEETDAAGLSRAIRETEDGLAHLPEVELGEAEAALFCSGRDVPAEGAPASAVRVKSHGKLLGVGYASAPGLIHPRKVLV